MNAIRKILRLVASLPPIRKYRLSRYRRAFFASGSSWPRFYGLFDSRTDAESAASSDSELVGYDHSEVANVSIDAMTQTWTSDYPVLFWISRLIPDSNEVFDLGGHVGTKYRAWRSYLKLPDTFTWTVCDLPRIVEAGMKMSGDLPQLRFSTNLQDLQDKDILLASGVLQYADFDLTEVLNDAADTPDHILINKIPTHDRPDAYTLENLHHSVVSYRIFNEEKFVSRINRLGYDLADRWTVPESSVRVPFTDLGKPVHLGFYFRKSGLPAD